MIDRVARLALSIGETPDVLARVAGDGYDLDLSQSVFERRQDRRALRQASDLGLLHEALASAGGSPELRFWRRLHGAERRPRTSANSMFRS